MNIQSLLCARHRARCLVSVILFNPDNSPPCLQMRKQQLRARLLHPKLLEKIPQLCKDLIWALSFIPWFYKQSSWAPSLIPFPTVVRPLPVSSSNTFTPFSFSRWERLWVEEGRFSNSSPLPPINLSTEMPLVLCEMRQCKINT